MKSQNTPLISIGMPVYNGARYIREAIDSLLEQTFAEFELIISDNASTDATESICRRYAEQDSRIRYIRQLQNIDALPNFQFVLNEANGEYFMWAACDDVWDRNWVDGLRSALDKTGAGAAFGKLMHIDENSVYVSHPANGRTFEFDGSILRRRTDYYIEFERDGKANPIYSMFRRSVLGELEMATYSVDFHIVFNILLNTEIIPVPTTVLYKRIHATCAGRSSSNGSYRILHRLSNWLVPVDIGFLRGYFRYGSRIENILFTILLPIKIYLGYKFYWQIMRQKVRKKLTALESSLESVIQNGNNKDEK